MSTTTPHPPARVTTPTTQTATDAAGTVTTTPTDTTGRAALAQIVFINNCHLPISESGESDPTCITEILKRLRASNPSKDTYRTISDSITPELLQRAIIEAIDLPTPAELDALFRFIQYIRNANIPDLAETFIQTIIGAVQAQENQPSGPNEDTIRKFIIPSLKKAHTETITQSTAIIMIVAIARYGMLNNSPDILLEIYQALESRTAKGHGLKNLALQSLPPKSN